MENKMKLEKDATLMQAIKALQTCLVYCLLTLAISLGSQLSKL